MKKIIIAVIASAFITNISYASTDKKEKIEKIVKTLSEQLKQTGLEEDKINKLKDCATESFDKNFKEEELDEVIKTLESESAPSNELGMKIGTALTPCLNFN